MFLGQILDTTVYILKCRVKYDRCPWGDPAHWLPPGGRRSGFMKLSLSLSSCLSASHACRHLTLMLYISFSLLHYVKPTMQHSAGLFSPTPLVEMLQLFYSMSMCTAPLIKLLNKLPNTRQSWAQNSTFSCLINARMRADSNTDSRLQVTLLHIHTHSCTHMHYGQNVSQTTKWFVWQLQMYSNRTSSMTHRTLWQENMRRETWEGSARLWGMTEEEEDVTREPRQSPGTAIKPAQSTRNLVIAGIGDLITTSPMSINNYLHESIVPGRVFPWPPPSWRENHTFTSLTGPVFVQGERQRVCPAGGNQEVSTWWPGPWSGGFRTGQDAFSRHQVDRIKVLLAAQRKTVITLHSQKTSPTTYNSLLSLPLILSLRWPNAFCSSIESAELADFLPSLLLMAARRRRCPLSLFIVPFKD